METHNIKFKRGLSASKRNAVRTTYQKLINKRKKHFAALNKPILQLAKQVNKALKPIVLRSDEKALKALRDKTTTEVVSALLKDRNPAIHDAVKIKSAVTRFKDRFRTEIKNHSKLLAIKQRYHGEVRSAFETALSHFTVSDDIVVADLQELEFDPAFATVFKPPFDFGETNDLLTGGVSASLPQLDLQSGFISYRFFMEHESRNWFNIPRSIVAYVGVGMGFTMPRTGVVQVTVTIQSTLAFLHARITDKRGFSDGFVQISAGVYLNILHPNNISINEHFMTNLPLSTGGDDVVSFINNLPRENPYRVVLTSTGAFAEGERFNILVGTVVRAFSQVDDMNSESSAIVSWQVKRVLVQVI